MIWVRQKVIEKIIHHDEEYLKNPAVVIEGLLNSKLREATLRKDLLNNNEIDRLFSNIEELLDFRVKFLELLKKY